MDKDLMQERRGFLKQFGATLGAAGLGAAGVGTANAAAKPKGSIPAKPVKVDSQRDLGRRQRLAVGVQQLHLNRLLLSALSRACLESKHQLHFWMSGWKLIGPDAVEHPHDVQLTLTRDVRVVC